MQKPKEFDFYKEFDETYFTPTKTWNVCCEGYFNLLGVEKNQVLLDAIKPYFGHVLKEHKLSYNKLRGTQHVGNFLSPSVT